MTTTPRPTPAQLRALKAVDEGAVYLRRHTGRFWSQGRRGERIRADVIERLYVAGLVEVGERDILLPSSRHVVLTEAGREALGVEG